MMRHPRFVENNFGYLLVGLLTSFLLIPILRVYFGDSLRQDTELMRDFLPIGFSLLMLIGVWGFHADRRIFGLGLGLTALQIGLAVAELLHPGMGLKFCAIVSAFAFCLLSIFLAGRHVFSWNRADLNTLMGAVCVYLLLGVIWAMIYGVFAYAWPEASFNGITFREDTVQFDNYLYYSFVTLTTAGYGDITPINPVIRTLAYLEMIVGQFYMAILVAGLVGLFMGKRIGS